MNQLLLMTVSDDKKDGKNTSNTDEKKERNEIPDAQIDIKEILKNQESLEHELQSLISQKFAMESELTEVKE